MPRTADHHDDYPLSPALDFMRRLWRLNHALERLSSTMHRRLGITAQQRFLLRCVGRYPGMTAGSLAEVLHVDPGTVSASLKRLEDEGLLERRRDPKDKRRVTVGLTKQGRALDVPATGTVEHAVDELLAETSPAQLHSMARVVEQLTEALLLQAVEPASPAARTGRTSPRTRR